MRNPDSVFAKEFKEMMNGRRSMVYNFNINSIPVPNLPTLITKFTINPETQREEMSKKDRLYLVRDIKEPYFEKLNGSQVKLIVKDEILKRKANSDGEFIIRNGNYVYDKIEVKPKFKVIHSNIPIGLKNKVVTHGVERIYRPTDGFRYVDYFESGGERRYIYIIPEENIHPLNMCSLIITQNKHRDFYTGYKVALQNGHYIYLYVIDLSERRNRGYRIVGAKTSADFNLEIQKLLAYWTKMNIMFDTRLTALEYQVNSVTNLGIEKIPETLDIFDFKELS